jgi:chromate transporter
MLKRFAIFYRSLEGINAAVVGIMLGATLYLSKDFAIKISNENELIWVLSALVFIASTYLVFKQKIATHWMVTWVVLLGIASSYFF